MFPIPHDELPVLVQKPEWESKFDECVEVVTRDQTLIERIRLLKEWINETSSDSNSFKVMGWTFANKEIHGLVFDDKRKAQKEIDRCLCELKANYHEAVNRVELLKPYATDH